MTCPGDALGIQWGHREGCSRIPPKVLHAQSSSCPVAPSDRACPDSDLLFCFSPQNTAPSLPRHGHLHVWPSVALSPSRAVSSQVQILGLFHQVPEPRWPLGLPRAPRKPCQSQSPVPWFHGACTLPTTDHAPPLPADGSESSLLGVRLGSPLSSKRRQAL